MAQRGETAPALDCSLIPSQEKDYGAVVTISDDNDHPIDLSTIGFVPLILLVRADGDFCEGADVPDQAKDLWRDAGQVWSLAIAGKTTWHFKRKATSGTVNLYIKVLGSN